MENRIKSLFVVQIHYNTWIHNNRIFFFYQGLCLWADKFTFTCRNRKFKTETVWTRKPHSKYGDKLFMRSGQISSWPVCRVNWWNTDMAR